MAASIPRGAFMIMDGALQGSAEWVKARLGIPTASQFHRILTPKTRKPSASADGYLYELIAEWALGHSVTEEASQFMERGIEMEEEAVAYYEVLRGVDTQAVGLCFRDDRMVGCSPDRLIGDDGLLEVKVPSAKVHVSYVLGDLTEEYRCQTQGQLWVTGRAWLDLLSYSPGMPSVVVRVERDEEFISLLATQVDLFIDRLLDARAEMIARGFTPRHKEAA